MKTNIVLQSEDYTNPVDFSKNGILSIYDQTDTVQIDKEQKMQLLDFLNQLDLS